MSGPGFPDHFADNDIIPHFAKNGTALTQEERAAIAKRKGLCVQCGVKTHVISVFKRAPVNSDDVYKGICIKCNPTSVPMKVYQDYEHRNPRQNAPAVARHAKQVITMAAAANRAKKRVADRPTSNSITASAGQHHADQRQSHSSGNSSLSNSAGRNTGGTTTLKSSSNKIPGMLPKTNSKGAKPLNQVDSRPCMNNEPSYAGPLGHSMSAELDFQQSFNTSTGTSQSSVSFVKRQSTNLQEDYTGDVDKPSDVDVGGLLDKLREDRQNAEELRKTLHQLRNFGFEDDARGVLSEIRDLMYEYSNDAKIMSVACGALWRLSAGVQSLKIEAAENGTIESIIDAMRKEHNLEDADFMQWSLGCLASLAHAEEVKVFLAKIGGIEVIVDGLNRHSHSAGVFEWGARALHNLAFQQQGGSSNDIVRNLSSIEETNGIAALVGAMKQHPNEVTAQRWAMRLLWKMQDQEDDDDACRVLKKMKDEGFVKVAVKILKARSTEEQTDLFRLSAELMCNILVSERSDSAFRDAADCMTTIARSLKEGAGEDGVKHAVKMEASCRVVATLMNGTDYSRMLVGEASGVQAILDAVESSLENTTLIQNAIWAFWALSAHNENEDAFLIKASTTIYGAVESQLAKNTDLLLPTCGFYPNMCMVPGMQADAIPIVAIVQALLSVEDNMILQEAEKAVSNFLCCFPDQVDLVVDSFNIEYMLEILQSEQDLSPTVCGVVSSVASRSDRARGRMVGIIEALVAKLEEQESPFMVKPYLELLGTLVIGSGNHKSTRMPDYIVQVVLMIIRSCESQNIHWICCALLRNLIISTASSLNLNGLVNAMVAVVESQSTSESLKIQACSVLWALTTKYTKQDVQTLSDIFRCVITVLVQYKGDLGPFDYDLLAAASGALASITSCMKGLSIPISSDDVDEIIAVPYTAFDFEAERTEVYVRILDSIYNLSYVSDAVLIQCGVIVVVIDTMAEFEQCLEIQQFGCAILAVLASTENLQVNLSIVQTDGIDMIINALALFSDDNVVQLQACKALSHLSIDEESRMLMASLGGLMLLGNAMRTNMDSLDLLEGALSAVLSLSADADVELLTESDIIAVVIAVMRHHCTNSQIQEFGMGVLQNISMRHFDSKETIAEFGGITAVTDCIREFMGSPTVLERAFTTLWSLAVLDKNQALIAECDGINLVVNGMMTAIGYEGVQKQGCGCLCTLSSDSRNKGLIQNVGGVDSIVYAMWGHYGAEEIQVEACRALSSLAVDAQTNEVMIASDGEVNAIISAMRRFPHSERLQEHACVAFRNFLLSADNVDILRSNEHEVRTLINRAASRFPEACQERAHQILASLG